MADVTISQIPNEMMSPAADDWLEIEDEVTGGSFKIRKSNLLGALLSGGGVVDTAGFTLTVPATGAAALRDVAQTFSAAQTFSSVITAIAGIDLVTGDTLSNYDAGTWTPVEANISFASQAANYVRIGQIVISGFALQWPATGDGNNVSISGLPYSAVSPGSTDLLYGGLIGLTTYGSSNIIVTINAAADTVQLRDYSNSRLTNANLSSAHLRGVLVWIAPSV